MNDKSTDLKAESDDPPAQAEDLKATAAWVPDTATMTGSEQDELRGIARTVAEIGWLLLVLALVYLVLQHRQLPEGALVSILAAMGCYAAFVMGMRVFNPERARSRIAIGAQTLAMIAFITWVLWTSGDGTGPLANLYHLVIITSALTLGTMATVIELGIIAACLLMLGRANGEHLVPGFTGDFVFQIAPMLLVAYVTTMLSSDIRGALRRIRSLSETDELTRLYNLRAFRGIAARLHRQAARYRRPYALVMIDSDNLKTVNDAHGHSAGDDLLRMTTDGIRSQLRDTDIAARYGGDEFIVLLPETAATGARELAERIRRRISEQELDVGGRRVGTSVSVGIAAYPEHGTELQSILNKADQAMYLSKKQGRNRINVFEAE